MDTIDGFFWPLLRKLNSRQSGEAVLGNPWLCSFHGPLDVLLLHPEVVGDVLAPERLPAALKVLLVQPHRLQLLHRDAFFQTGNCVICYPLLGASQKQFQITAAYDQLPQIVQCTIYMKEVCK